MLHLLVLLVLHCLEEIFKGEETQLLRKEISRMSLAQLLLRQGVIGGEIISIWKEMI